MRIRLPQFTVLLLAGLIGLAAGTAYGQAEPELVLYRGTCVQGAAAHVDLFVRGAEPNQVVMLRLSADGLDGSSLADNVADAAGRAHFRLDGLPLGAGATLRVEAVSFVNGVITSSNPVVIGEDPSLYLLVEPPPRLAQAARIVRFDPYSGAMTTVGRSESRRAPSFAVAGAATFAVVRHAGPFGFLAGIRRTAGHRLAGAGA